MSDTPLYTSKRTAKSLGQEYRIYPDRLELQSWFLLHTIVVPTNEIVDISIRPPAIGKRGFYPEGITWGIKLDNSDFCRHVLLTKKSGLFKRMSFTPDEPEKFVEVCKSIVSND